MPTYDYRCTVCGRDVEVVHGIHGSGPETCTWCGGAMKKALSTPAIHFKGSGWAKKDAQDASKARSSAGTASAPAAAASTDGASSSADTASGAASTAASEGTSKGGEGTDPSSSGKAATDGKGTKGGNAANASG